MDWVGWRRVESGSALSTGIREMIAWRQLWEQPRLIVSTGLWFCVAACAQTTGAITGTIEDATRHVLAGVKLSVRHLDTGMSRTTQTSADGRYLIPAAAPGEYEIRAEMPGFRPYMRKGLQVTIGQMAVVDFAMEVGPVDQTITVVASASAVNTHSGELSYLVAEEAIRELPLNGRNYTDLALLQPGVVSYPHRDGGSVVAHGLGISVNGQDPRSNVFLLDGTPQNDITNGPAGSAAGTALGTETIREFRVETNAYSAEFGRNSGGQINAISKSGTNDLHGSLYEFHRNDNLDARNFFDAAGKPEFKRNQFGGAVGGPIKRDRTFFFVGYEALRERLGKTISTIGAGRQRRARESSRARRPFPSRRKCGLISSSTLSRMALTSAADSPYTISFSSSRSRSTSRRAASIITSVLATRCSRATPWMTRTSYCPPITRSSRATSFRATSLHRRSAPGDLVEHVERRARRFQPDAHRANRSSQRAGRFRSLYPGPGHDGRHRRRRADALRAAELRRISG